MSMRNYSTLLLDINSSKGTEQIIAVLHFTVTVGSSTMSKTAVLHVTVPVGSSTMSKMLHVEQINRIGCFCPQICATLSILCLLKYIIYFYIFVLSYYVYVGSEFRVVMFPHKNDVRFVFTSSCL